VGATRAAAFGAGLLALFSALVSPLHALGSALFSAHMAQHVVLMLMAAPLLALGAPLQPSLWALPVRWRRLVGRGARALGLRRAWRTLARPLAAWILHAAAVWVWHAPRLYEAALRNEALHAAQHASFLGTAILFWWVLVRPGRRRRASAGIGLAYVFTTMLHGGALGALLTFSSEPWYPAYAATTAAWGLEPLQDQQLGGLLMWVPAGLVYLLAGLALFAAGLGPDEDSVPRPPGGGARPALLALVAATLAGGCERESRIRERLLRELPAERVVAGGDPRLGPPQGGVRDRVYLAGRLPNTPENLVSWIEDPQGVDPGNAMPDVGVPPAAARHVAAYLYTLR
jgi:putative membrane protein